MIVDFENTRKSIAKGLKEYLQCKVIRGNQTAETPAFPYCVYNITTLASRNNSTYGVYEDGKARKPVTMTMSFTSRSDDYSEAVMLASKAREWLEYAGRTYLNDNNVIVQSVGNITDRSNLITVEYMYSYGFDVVLWLFDEVGAEQAGEGEIETATINEITAEKISALESVLEAILVNGVDVPEDTDPTEYGALINQACQTQYDKGYNQGFYDNSPDGVIAEIIAIIDESGVLE